jgi:hypothetical protein
VGRIEKLTTKEDAGAIMAVPFVGEAKGIGAKC